MPIPRSSEPPSTADEAGPGRVLDLSLPGQDAAVREVLEQVDRVFVAEAIPEALMQPAQIVLGEVLNNVVEHAYPDHAAGLVRLWMMIRADQVICEVRDTGGEMPDGPLPGDSFPDADPDEPLKWPEGGFGWALVRELTQGLAYERVAGENILRFRILPDAS